jgi:siroheme synthase (precorrin-2 oxidase/ferrochelatase)
MGGFGPSSASLPPAMGSLIKKRRKRMRKKKHKKMLKRTRWQRRAAGK